MRFLVVDDEPEILLLVRANLAPLGHECTTAETAEEAAGALAAGLPDVLILDVAMPGINGVELLADLRRRGLAPRRVLLLSAIPPEELVALAVDLDAEWLSKPFTVAEFLEALERVTGPYSTA